MALGVDRRLQVSVARMDDNVQKKLKQAITVRLAETRDHVEKELPEYIMSMITNKKSKNYMHKNLEAFIGEDASIFCDWVFDLVEKINDSAVPDIPRSSESEGDHADSGSYPANIIKNVREKEEKERESRSKPSSSSTHRDSDRHRTDDSRKRKVEEERKTRVPIEPPRRDKRISSKRESERERAREKERERDRDRHRVIRKDTRDRRDRSNSRRRHSDSRRESTSHRKPIKFESSASEEEDDDEDMPQSTVASKVVASRRVEKAPTVSSQVTVKRHVRKMGDEKLMKARSSMFLKALTDASHSASGEPSTKAARIVERMESSSDKAPTGSIEERIVRVRIDVSKPPTKRMEERLRRMKEKKEAPTSATSEESKGKRKHEEIVFDLSDDDRILLDSEDDYDEAEIDKIVEETKVEETVVEPPSKRIANNKDFVDNAEEDMDMTQMKKKIRCSFWPKCTRGDACHYLHPNAVCTMFPKCSFGQKCHYIHPPCKFVDRCLNKKCAYTHGDPEVMNMLSYYFPAHMLPKPKPVPVEVFPEIEPDVPLSRGPRKLCRYADNCMNPNCPFEHPPLCRFGDQCINEKCSFFHPAAPLPMSAMKKTNPSLYKWSATQNS